MSLLSFILFADDTNLFISCKNSKELNRKMNHLQVWFEDSQLTLNLKKINYIVFKSRRQKFKKRIEDNPE